MSQKQLDILERALGREKLARKQAEKILESKSAELYNLTLRLKESNQKLESLLRQKTSQLQGVFENINDAYLIMDLKGNVIKMNDTAIKLFGYNNEDEKLNVVDLIYKEDEEYAFKSFETLKTRGSFLNYRARVNTKNRGVRWVHINASLIYSNDNIPIAAQGIIRDITLERERSLMLDMINNVAKSILGKVNIYDIAKEITNKIAVYLDTFDCVIYLVDHDTNTLEQIAAYGAKLDTKNNIINKITLPIGDGITGSVAKSGKAEIINDTSLDKRYVIDDKRRFSEITVPIISDGKVIGVIDSEHISKNHFTKQHLSTLKNIASLVSMQLKSAIHLREREEAESKNALLLDALAKSNDELQEYAHIVSHDLKSPLRSINALMHWIKEDNIDKFDQVTHENFGLIENTIDKMEQLISDILTYSSLDTQVDDLQEVDLYNIVSDLKQLLFIPDHIKILINNKLPTVLGERAKLQQLFQNLISNAIKFNDKKEGLIEINFIEKKSFYQFSIKDNGMGIDMKYEDKIFKIFHSLNKSKESTGIGLSIVKKIIDLYKGEIWVESELEIGTTFYFTLKK